MYEWNNSFFFYIYDLFKSVKSHNITIMLFFKLWYDTLTMFENVNVECVGRILYAEKKTTLVFMKLLRWILR